jgi:hypothetical protein
MRLVLQHVVQVLDLRIEALGAIRERRWGLVRVVCMLRIVHMLLSVQKLRAGIKLIVRRWGVLLRHETWSAYFGSVVNR